MKIVYVDYQYHYGKEEQGINDIGVNGFMGSLITLGHSVTPFFYDDLVSDKSHLNETLVKFCSVEKPDLVFFVLAHDLFDCETLSSISSNYKTVNYFGDDHWRFESFTKKLAHCFSYCVTTDQFAIKKYHEIGCSNVIYSQWAALDPLSAETLEKSSYRYDVSFIGWKTPYRAWFVNYLKSKGIDVECFGVGWDKGPVSLAEMNAIFSQTKINLNISNSRSYDLRFLAAMPVSFARQLLRSSKDASQIKARNFEIPAYNGFQLTDYVPGIEQYLRIGKEVACYNTPDDAINLIGFYLNDDELREKIKVRGALRTRSEHLYINRVAAILDRIK